MMSAEHGIWDRALGPRGEMLDYLMDSYIRRKRWEWEQQAVHIVNALSKAMSGDTGKPKKQQDPFIALRKMGVKVPDGPNAG